jgi:hypothetical protein
LLAPPPPRGGGPPGGHHGPLVAAPPLQVDVVVERLEICETECLQPKPVTLTMEHLAPCVTERPVDLRKDVLQVVRQSVPIETIQERVAECQCPVLLERYVDVIVEVPVEQIVPKIVERVVERLVEVPVVRVIKSRKIVPVERVVEKRIEVPVETTVVRRVEVPYDRVVERFEEVIVDRIVERRVEVFVDRIVERVVHVPVDILVERVVEVEVEEQVVVVPVEKRECLTEAPLRVTLQEQGYVPPRAMQAEWVAQRVSAAEQRNRSWLAGSDPTGPQPPTRSTGCQPCEAATPSGYSSASATTAAAASSAAARTSGIGYSTYADGRPLTPVRPSAHPPASSSRSSSQPATLPPIPAPTQTRF